MLNRKQNEINKEIMENELAATEWELYDLVWELDWWMAVFQAIFFRDTPLPIPLLTFEKTRVTNLGYFRLGLNDFAVKNQINLNRIHINRPLNELLQTLVHEIVHMWEQVYVPEEKRTKNWYHTKTFREKLGEIGIFTDTKGCHVAVGDPFRYILEKLGVGFPDLKEDYDAGVLVLPPRKKKKGSSKLKKWVCGCTQSVRIGKKEFFATCDLCNQKFALAE